MTWWCHVWGENYTIANRVILTPYMTSSCHIKILVYYVTNLLDISNFLKKLKIPVWWVWHFSSQSRCSWYFSFYSSTQKKALDFLIWEYFWDCYSKKLREILCLERSFSINEINFPNMQADHQFDRQFWEIMIKYSI